MNAAIVGCGGVASAHIKALKKIDNIRVIALCDLNLEKARNLANRFQITRTYEDYWNMLEAEDITLVDICTPVSTHAAIVCDVAKAAPAILVEKPMALNVSECEKMIKQVKKYGSKLCVGHAQIFSPHIRKAKFLIDNGEFNPIFFKTSQKESFELLRKHNLAPAWNVTPQQRGIIWEVCCHLAYLQLHFLPNICEVYAVGSKVKYPVYDDFAVLLRTTDKRFGLIELSWITKETEIVYELRDSIGRRLQVYRDFDYFLEKNAYPPLNIASAMRNFLLDEKRVLAKWTRFGLSYIRSRKVEPIFSLIRQYVHCVEEDLPPPITPEDGKNTINLLECIEQSLNTHHSVTLSS